MLYDYPTVSAGTWQRSLIRYEQANAEKTLWSCGGKYVLMQNATVLHLQCVDDRSARSGQDAAGAGDAGHHARTQH